MIPIELTILVEIAFGLVLLFLGLRYLRLTVSVYGVFVGLFVASVINARIDMNSAVELAIVLACAIVAGAFAVSFYRLFVQLSIALFVILLTYMVFSQFGIDMLVTTIAALSFGILAFVLAASFNVVDKLFIFVSAMQGSALLLSVVAFFVTDYDRVALGRGDIVGLVRQSVIWLIAWLALAIFGMVIQYRSVDTRRADIV